MHNDVGGRRPRVLNALKFVDQMRDLGGYRSIPDGPVTLYGTCYAYLTRFYLGWDGRLPEESQRFIVGSQDSTTGLMVGPELIKLETPLGVLHDREHLLLHLTCTAIPLCLHFGIKLPFLLKDAYQFCDKKYLKGWMDRRNFKNAWFEGNNILFIGQLLVYLRDHEGHPDADKALQYWFEWLDEHVDLRTGIWGTNGYCPTMEAVYGGYHQLLVYYHENHPVRNPHGLVDTVLALRHPDGGFNPNGNGGACEDADCVDILVNMYKQLDYRRPEIRAVLRSCARHILGLQNRDGGFPYNRDCPQSHMGIPGTQALPNESTMFATWFRVHTLALIAEILTDEQELQFPFRFTNNLSMGWHRTWDKAQHPITTQDREEERIFEWRWRQQRTFFLFKRQSRAFARTIYRVRKAAGRLRRNVLKQ